MSSQISANANDLFVRPPEIDEGAYLRIRQMRPVEKAVAPIVDHNIELTELASDSRAWYRGETLVVPMEYMSLKLNPDMNNATDLLAGFADTVKGFSHGSFPGHCHAVRELEFTTKHLICTLSGLVDGAATAFASALRHLGALFAAISDPAGGTMQKHDFDMRIDARLGQLLESFRGVSRAFEQREHEIKFRAVVNANAEETLAVVRDTNAVVRRIDARGVRRGLRAMAKELQEACYRYWEIGCEKPAVKNASNGRPRHEDVFAYFRRELAEIGVETCEEFSKLLVRRQKRLSQSACGKWPSVAKSAAEPSARRGKNGIIQAARQGRTWQRDC